MGGDIKKNVPSPTPLNPVLKSNVVRRSPWVNYFQKRNLNRVYIRTNNGVFAFSITGNITDDKKSKILQNANYFSDESK